MTRVLLISVFTCGVGTVAAAQNADDQAERRRQIERTAQVLTAARAAIETRVTHGAPYAADAVTEFVHVLADGNRIVRKATVRVYRDSEGRTRRETINDSGEAIEIMITDPPAGAGYVLNPSTRTAQRGPAMFAKVMVGPNQPIDPDDRVRVIVADKLTERIVPGHETLVITREREGRGGAATKEDLGQQTIEGVMATGTRTTTTVPAGAIGNEQPLTTVSEQWFSQELGVLVLTKHSDPRTGETTYRLTNIRRGEPDRSLFQVPSDYTLTNSLMRRPML